MDSYSNNNYSQDTMVSNPTAVSNETMVSGFESAADYVWMIGLELQGSNGVYKIESILGEGGEAIIFVCSKEGIQYVIKYYVNVRMMAKKKRDAFVSLLHNQSSPYIVPLVDYGEYDHKYFDVYPYVKNGNLADNPVTLDFIRDVIVPNVNEALKLVHSFNIAHRDIKPNNILLSDDGSHVMLNDFSIMSVVEETTGGAYTTTAYRTNGYASPEILMMMPNKISDYYALGVSLLSLINGGENLFKDMDEAMIYNCTVNGKIPKLDKEKFASLSKSTLSLRDRIEGLILGLTIYDHKKRWGYDEVKKWCEGIIDFPVIDKDSSNSNRKNTDFEFSIPYTGIKGEQLYTRREIVEYYTNNWEIARQDLMRGVISGWFASQRPDIASKLNRVIEESGSKQEDSDCTLYRAIYTIDESYPGICWKGKIYKELSSLAGDVGNGVTNIDMMLRCKLLSWMIGDNDSFSNNSKAIDDAIHEIEDLAIMDIETAKHLFAFQFESNRTAQTFDINNKSFTSIDELISYICESNSVDARTILNNKKFKAWLIFNGFGQIYKNATNYIDGADNDECYKRLVVMLSHISNDSRLGELVRNKSRSAHLFWVKENIDQYDFISKEAIDIKNKILGVNIYEGMSIEELYSTIEKLDIFYETFSNMNYMYPFKIACRVVPVEDMEAARTGKTGKAQIFPKTTGAALVYKKDGLLLPAQYVHLNNIEGCVSYVSDSNINSCIDSTCGEIRKVLHEEEWELQDDYHRFYSNVPMKMIGLIVLAALLISFGGLYGNPYFVIGIVGLAYPAYRFIELIFCAKQAPIAERIQENIEAYRKRVDEWKNNSSEIVKALNQYYATRSLNVIRLNTDECSYYTESAKKVHSAFKTEELHRYESSTCRFMFILTTAAIAAIISGGLIFGEFVYGMLGSSNTDMIEVIVVITSIVACIIFDFILLKDKRVSAPRLIGYPVCAITATATAGGLIALAAALVAIIVQIILSILAIVVIVGIIIGILANS